MFAAYKKHWRENRTDRVHLVPYTPTYICFCLTRAYLIPCWNPSTHAFNIRFIVSLSYAYIIPFQHFERTLPILFKQIQFCYEFVTQYIVCAIEKGVLFSSRGVQLICTIWSTNRFALNEGRAPNRNKYARNCTTSTPRTM